MCNLKVILLIFILCIIGYNIYIKNTYTDNFKNQNIKLILFYTNWCKFSRKLLPIWNKVVKDFGTKNIEFIKTDCDTNTKLCNKYKINYLPTIYLIKNNNKYKYTDNISYEELSLFVYKKLTS